MTLVTPPDCLLLISGLDPSGGAGLIADCATATSLGRNPAGVLTVLTEQDSQQLYGGTPVAPELLSAQLRRLLDDLSIAAVKIGALGSADNARAIATALQRLQVPIVWDPVIEASRGMGLTQAGTMEVACEVLLPRVSVLTPNREELQRLLAICKLRSPTQLLRLGPTALIVTGGDDDSNDIRLEIHTRTGLQTLQSPRVAGQFRGTGCTFSTALATALADGKALEAAVHEASEFTRACLERARSPGQGTAIPDRAWR